MNLRCGCGCCEGLEILTPMLTANRPGLSALSYRVGIHATFLTTMEARLSSLYLEIPADRIGSWKLDPPELFNPGRFAEHIKRPEDTLSQHLRAQFSGPTLQLVDAHDRSRPASDQLLDALVKELNKLIAGPSQFDQTRFARVTFRKASWATIQSTRSSGLTPTRGKSAGVDPTALPFGETEVSRSPSRL